MVKRAGLLEESLGCCPLVSGLRSFCVLRIAPGHRELLDEAAVSSERKKEMGRDSGSTVEILAEGDDRAGCWSFDAILQVVATAR